MLEIQMLRKKVLIDKIEYRKRRREFFRKHGALLQDLMKLGYENIQNQKYRF